MLLMDAYSPWYFSKASEGTQNRFLKKMHSMLKWSLCGFYEIEEWSPQITIVIVSKNIFLEIVSI